MMNQLMNISMLNSYQECTCELFEKNCHITQCFRCHEFDHMIKFCKKNQHCEKYIDKLFFFFFSFKFYMLMQSIIMKHDAIYLNSRTEALCVS